MGITIITNLKSKCEKEKKKIEIKISTWANDTSEKINKIKFEYEQKITKIEINLKNCERNTKIDIENIKQRLDYCNKKIIANKDEWSKEKIYYEKIIHEKEMLIIKEIEKCNKEK